MNSFVIFILSHLIMLVTGVFPLSDPYAWGDLIPSCHPLLEEHHSPINVDQAVTRNQSLGSLHLVGFDDTQTGHWTLENDGHYGEHTTGCCA